MRYIIHTRFVYVWLVCTQHKMMMGPWRHSLSLPKYLCLWPERTDSINYFTLQFSYRHSVCRALRSLRRAFFILAFALFCCRQRADTCLSRPPWRSAHKFLGIGFKTKPNRLAIASIRFILEMMHIESRAVCCSIINAAPATMDGFGYPALLCYTQCTCSMKAQHCCYSEKPGTTAEATCSYST